MKNTASPSFICASCARALRTSPSTRSFSTTVIPNASSSSGLKELRDNEQHQLPRWKQTPARMSMPIRLRPRTQQAAEWKVNTDDEKLNLAYDRFLGRVAGSKKGRELLDDETKWIAITHKSHDHGRQGINDRLAFLGKRILDLQTSLSLLASPIPPHLSSLSPQEVYRHPALEGLENVSALTKAQILDKSRLARLATSYGLDQVVRWKPRQSRDLRASGLDVVLSHTMYSIIGALALKQGGEVAATAARERILQPLGLR